MTPTPRPDPEVIRLRVTQQQAVDTEGPFIDDSSWSRPLFDGSLALALPLARGGTRARLRVLPGNRPRRADEDGPRAAEARLWEDASPPPPGEAGGAADEVTFAPVATPRPELPPPGPHAATLVRAVLEVLAGDRPLRQLSRCASEQVLDDLEVLVSPRAARPWAGSLRRLVLCEPVPGVAEVTAVISQGARTAAMALRLEGMDGRWQVTALQLV